MRSKRETTLSYFLFTNSYQSQHEPTERENQDKRIKLKITNAIKLNLNDCR